LIAYEKLKENEKIEIAKMSKDLGVEALSDYGSDEFNATLEAIESNQNIYQATNDHQNEVRSHYKAELEDVRELNQGIAKFNADLEAIQKAAKTEQSFFEGNEDLLAHVESLNKAVSKIDPITRVQPVSDPQLQQVDFEVDKESIAKSIGATDNEADFSFDGFDFEEEEPDFSFDGFDFEEEEPDVGVENPLESISQQMDKAGLNSLAKDQLLSDTLPKSSQSLSSKI